MATSTSPSPLSWDEARSILREILKDYLDSSVYKCDSIGSGPPFLPNKQESIFSKCIRHNLDLYAGALCSIILLILSSLSFHDRLNKSEDSSLNPVASLSLYCAELVGAIVLVIASLTNTWVVRRWRFLCLKDKENAKRREILKFLRAASDNDSNTDKNIVLSPKVETKAIGHDNVARIQLTAQTEVFPVFRKSGNLASWSSVPSLLLVKGDWIALQVGDIAPANCTTYSKDMRMIHICAGERVTMETFGCTAESATANLPIGRSVLTSNSSDHFLTLCNNMHICSLVDSPVLSSLNRSYAPAPSSQLSRQVKAIREAIFVFAIVILIATCIILVSRKPSTSSDVTFVVNMPILAALGALPIVAPAYIFGLEVLGTARILTAVHPYASSTNFQMDFSSTTRLLLCRYIFATGLSRLSLWSVFDSFYRIFHCIIMTGSPNRSKLIRIPPASVHLLEKLGVTTAFALVDDELACEPQLIPQQLLIPSAKGLKLLDLCPIHDGDAHHDDDESENTESGVERKQRAKSFDSDSESEDGMQTRQISIRRRVLPKRLRRQKIKTWEGQDHLIDESSGEELSRFDVQFEEPDWWHYLPSLKCVGLACLLLDENLSVDALSDDHTACEGESSANFASQPSDYKYLASVALAKVVCNERQSKQLVSLAECIGFSKEENSYGERGDISTFKERLRLHVLSNRLFKERLELDSHERSSEQSRWWGLLRPDVTSVIVQDSRTKSFQLLSVGDPLIVCSLCNEAWQGEISTILPFAAEDRKTIIETTNTWKLADLDVAAFSYTPIPHTLEALLSADRGSRHYLFDHTESTASLSKEKGVVSEWSFLGNQIFVGVLGSLVVPRVEIRKLLNILSNAGVRFVYFSPRNMRRQKELAMQMGIDVAWNCAISLRPLESGEDDPHRMVSNYADWDVNAKLPHGVPDVRKHLYEVDNVPLLVSLYTDATKETTKEMVEIFQEYDDTVIAVGLSHLTLNEGIFASADIAVGIDILEETFLKQNVSGCLPLRKFELEFVQSMSSQSCAFRLRGAASVAFISKIIEKSRASLDAAVASTIFLVYGCVAFSLYVLFSVCTPLTTIPYVPTLGSAIYLSVILPCVGMALQMSDGDKDNMKHVPPKNDRAVGFTRSERSLFYLFSLTKALFPALLPQILHLIVFGELVINFDPIFVAENCPSATTWVDIVRCDGMKNYTGTAETSAGSIVFAQFMMCVVTASAAFVHRFLSLKEQLPWERNISWLYSVLISFGIVITYAVLSTEHGSAEVLPWYFYLISITTPLLCLLWVEVCKRPETKQELRAEKLRRLQFETRLGAWSPR